MPPFPPNNTPPGGPMPMGPPPSRTPQKPAQMRGGTKMVSPGSMRNCIGRFTYVWLSNGQEFWFFPVQIWANTVAGFRWDRRFGWSYTGISLNRIRYVYLHLIIKTEKRNPGSGVFLFQHLRKRLFSSPQKAILKGSSFCMSFSFPLGIFREPPLLHPIGLFRKLFNAP